MQKTIDIKKKTYVHYIWHSEIHSHICYNFQRRDYKLHYCDNDHCIGIDSSAHIHQDYMLKIIQKIIDLNLFEYGILYTKWHTKPYHLITKLLFFHFFKQDMHYIEKWLILSVSDESNFQQNLFIFFSICF